MTRKNIRIRLLLKATYLNNFGWALYSPLYALFVLQLGGTAVDVSLIWSGYALLTGLLIMAFGQLENLPRYNPSFMLIIGYLLFVGVAAGYYFIDTIQQFYVMQAILALAMGIMTPAAKATYMKAEHKGSEAGEWGLFDGGNYIIGAAAAGLGGLLIKFSDFRMIFIAMTAIQLMASFYAFIHWKRYAAKHSR